MEAEERQFYVLLTIFGAVFGIGPFVAFEAAAARTLWVGVVLTLIGLAGLVMLIRDLLHIKQRIAGVVGHKSVQLALKLMGVFSVWILIAMLVYSLHGLRSDLDAYVMPRYLAKQQVSDLGKFLSAHNSDVTVQIYVNVADREAMEYAGQIRNAIVNGGWNADFKPINPWYPDKPEQHDRAISNMFLVLDSGLEIRICIPGQPVNPDPKHPPPDALLADAFRSANIEVNGGGESADCGKYSLNVIVGHRPTVIGDQSPIRLRLARWLMRSSE